MGRKIILTNFGIYVLGIVIIAMIGANLALGKFTTLFFSLYSAYWTVFLILINVIIGTIYILKKHEKKKMYFYNAGILLTLLLLAIIVMEITI